MKISEIRKDVPLPKGSGKVNPLIHANAERLEIGDSFSITLEDGDKLSARGVGCSLGRIRRDNGKKFKCHEAGKNVIRVWRVG